MSKEKNAMAVSTPSTREVWKVPGFDPLKFAKETGTRDGQKVLELDLPHKKNWFRLACPSGGMVLNALHVSDTRAIYEARLFANKDDRNPLASFTSTRTADKSTGKQYIQAAQEDALSEALSNAGFDIQLYVLAANIREEGQKQDIQPSDKEGRQDGEHSKQKPAQTADDVSKQPRTTTHDAASTVVSTGQQVTQPVSKQSEVQPQMEKAAPDVQKADNSAANGSAEKKPTAAKASADAHPAPVNSKPHNMVTEISTVPKDGTQVTDKQPDSKFARVEDISSKQQEHTAEKAVPPSESKKVTALTDESAEPAPGSEKSAYTAEMSVDEICQVMTLDEARSVVVDIGVCTGWTMSQVEKQRFASLRFFVTQFCKCGNIQKAAATLIIQAWERDHGQNVPLAKAG